MIRAIIDPAELFGIDVIFIGEYALMMNGYPDIRPDRLQIVVSESSWKDLTSRGTKFSKKIQVRVLPDEKLPAWEYVNYKGAEFKVVTLDEWPYYHSLRVVSIVKMLDDFRMPTESEEEVIYELRQLFKFNRLLYEG